LTLGHTTWGLEEYKHTSYRRATKGLENEANAEVPALFVMKCEVKKCDCMVGDERNDPTSHLIYSLSKHFPNEFMVSIASLYLNTA